MSDKSRSLLSGQNLQEPVLANDLSDSIRFEVGLNLYLEFELHRKKRRAQAELIGWLKPTILITTCAIYDDRHLMAQEGKEFLVRFLHQGSVYGFVTKLTKKHQYPLPLWFLEYPKAIEVINLRGTPRLDVLLAAQSPEGDTYHIMNISASGAYLSVNDRTFDIDEDVIFSFTLPDGAYVDQMRAKIVRFQNTQFENYLGVRFRPDQREKMWLIGDYINRYLMIHGKK